MTQEDKELLLKDLCARLPYGVKVYCEWNRFQGDRISRDGELVSINIYYAKYIRFKRNTGRITEIPFNRLDGTVLPYLRPMSSMTEEELIQYKCLNDALDENYEVHIDNAYPAFDWLNAHHFDYRGLIEKGLAIEAPEGMYKTK